jgi:6-pyruvoyltetrahydropterin/6-carboxytetrahydropterin synthase
MVRLSRAIEFAASLRCARPDLSEAENRELFGRRAGQHGHNYRLEVTLRGEPDPVTGMVIDIKQVQEVLEREIMERFDHRDLNRDTSYFEKIPPTPEHFARVIREILVAAFPEGMLDRIRLQPDEDTWVEIVEPEVRA